ncbi:MAG TPA: hypothetical protein ACFE0H_12135 [Elainellaceae cyanobacterium]
MSLLRQYVAPALIVLVFLIAMLAVSARIFLPSDMAAPAPVEDSEQQVSVQVPLTDSNDSLPPSLRVFVQGLPDDLAYSTSI